MREDDLLRGVLDIMRMFGYRTLHLRPARTSKGWRTPVQGDGEGWPDVFAVRGHRLVAAELKSKRGAVTVEQTAWLVQLRAAGVETFVWRPEDFPDRIVEALR